MKGDDFFSFRSKRLILSQFVIFSNPRRSRRGTFGGLQVVGGVEARTSRTRQLIGLALVGRSGRCQ